MNIYKFLVLLLYSMHLSSCVNFLNNDLKIIELNSDMQIEKYIDLIGTEKRSGRIPILYYSAKWCLPCKPIDSMLYKNSYCISKLKGITVVKVNLPDNSVEPTKLIDKLTSRKTKFIPSFKIVNTDGEPERNIPYNFKTKTEESIDKFYTDILNNNDIYQNTIDLNHHFFFELELLDSAQIDWIEISSDFGKIRITESEMNGMKLIKRRTPMIGSDYITIETKRKGKEPKYDHGNRVSEGDMFRYRLHGVGWTVRNKKQKWGG